jgi:pimeloyl-ACP methyl ester carboxylesterase
MPEFIKSTDGLSIAYHVLPGKLPTVMFMPGFFSHMQGTKALWLEGHCRKRGQAYVRFDYRGHGESDGRFEEGTVSDWLNDTLLILDHVAKKPVVAAGSSMGGWIALLAALARPGAIAGLVGIASSPDFTRTIYEERLNDDQRREIDRQGFLRQPSEYQEEPVIITKKLIEDGEKHLVLHRDKLDLDIPVCLIHGKMDADVPWQKSLALQKKIGEDRCELILVPDGEHRLSRRQDLELIGRAVQNITFLTNQD